VSGLFGSLPVCRDSFLCESTAAAALDCICFPALAGPLRRFGAELACVIIGRRQLLAPKENGSNVVGHPAAEPEALDKHAKRMNRLEVRGKEPGGKRRRRCAYEEILGDGNGDEVIRWNHFQVA
jgi:hypothetical protein